MLLCLDVGNSHMHGGVFADKQLLLQFRYASRDTLTSDQLGVFFRNVLRENNIEYSAIKTISICSVVPSLDYSLRAAFIKYFNNEPFVLKPGVKTGLKISVKNPLEVGSDRIANAVAAINLFNNRNILIVDYGTATTFDVINAEKNYLGGVIMPGIKTSMEALHINTAKLSPVSIIKPSSTVGQTTTTNIQSGLYYCQLGALREIIHNVTKETFQGEQPIVIGTGGFAHLFEPEQLFHAVIPDLVLQGLRITAINNLN